jgi:hypothetical protein
MFLFHLFFYSFFFSNRPPHAPLGAFFFDRPGVLHGITNFIIWPDRPGLGVPFVFFSTSKHIHALQRDLTYRNQTLYCR